VRTVVGIPARRARSRPGLAFCPRLAITWVIFARRRGEEEVGSSA
jgi:hypothetical protein